LRKTNVAEKKTSASGISTFRVNFSHPSRALTEAIFLGAAAAPVFQVLLGSKSRLTRLQEPSGAPF